MEWRGNLVLWRLIVDGEVLEDTFDNIKGAGRMQLVVFYHSSESTSRNVLNVMEEVDRVSRLPYVFSASSLSFL